MDKESRKCYIDHITYTGTPIWIRDKISNTIHPMKKHISPKTTHNHQSTNKRYCYLLTQTPETVFLDYIFSSYNHPFSNQKNLPQKWQLLLQPWPANSRAILLLHSQPDLPLQRASLVLPSESCPLGEGPLPSLSRLSSRKRSLQFSIL